MLFEVLPMLDDVFNDSNMAVVQNIEIRAVLLLLYVGNDILL
jgi:hypothetical protein